MKKLLLILFSVTFFFAVSQVAFIQEAITLNNEEHFITPVFKHNDTIFGYYHNKDIEISEKFIKRIENSPLISALVDDTTMLANLKEAISENCKESYNDARDNPAVYNVENEIFNTFLHKLLKIKRVRDFAANLVKDILVEQCKAYPQDFKDSYVETLTDLLSFIKDIPQHNYKIRGKNLYIDGKRDDEEIAFDLRGFILRRYIIDEIPLEDISNYIIKTLNAIKAVDVSSNPKFMYEANINNNIRYVISSYGNFYQIGKNEEIFVYEDWRDLYEGSCITCHTDGRETLYTIEGGYMYNCNWNNYPEKIIVDSSGEILSRN